VSRLVKEGPLRDRYNILLFLLLVAKQPVVEPVTYSSGGLARYTVGKRMVDENTATDWAGRVAASLGR